MHIFFSIGAVITAYLLGSIATSVWIGRIFYNIDVREHGSGNAGATNTFRVLGKRAGIPVLIIDILKGWLAVSLINFSNYYIPGTNQYINFSLLLGIVAVLGHIFPLYTGFKGGKGVATLLGIILAIHPQAALITIGIFVVCLLLTQYVSLSSIVAGVTFPILIIAIFHVKAPLLIVFSIIISVLLLVTHQKNIVRLIKHEENKARLFKKKQE